MGLADGIDGAINASPELLNSPGLSLDAAGSQDPELFGQMVSHASTINANLKSVSNAESEDDPDHVKQSSGGILGALGGAVHWVGHAFQSIPGVQGFEHGVGQVLHYLSLPLHELQRDYRYAHLVWTKNGPVAGFLTTLGMVGAGVAGTVASGGNPEVGLLAAGTVAEATRGLATADVFGGDMRKTALLSGDPHVKISLGRDIANAVGQVPGLSTLQNTDQGIGKIVSGATDALADFTGDPLVVAAKIKTGLKFGEYGALALAARRPEIPAGMQDGKAVTAIRNVLNGDLLTTARTTKAQEWMDQIAPGIKVRNSEQIQRLYDAPQIGPIGAGASYKRAIEDIARINRESANRAAEGGVETASGTIAARYPALASLAHDVRSGDGKLLLQGLNRQTTAEDVHKFFVNVAADANFSARLDHAGVLPTRTITRSVGSNIAEWLRNIGPDTAESATAGAVANQRSLTGGTMALLGAPLAAARAAATKPAEGEAGRGAAASAAFGDAVDQFTGAIARKVRTFSGYMPYAIDKNTLALSTKSFHWSPQGLDPVAAQGVYRSMKFSMGEQRARYWTDRFLNAPDLASAKRIWAESQLETLKAAGLPDKNALVQNVQKQLAEMTAGPMTEPKQFFGFGHEQGSRVSYQPAGDGESPAALFAHQASTEFSFPNYNVLKQEMRKLQGAFKANYGRFDDLAARQYTNTIFKPLALMNAGFGFRVALSEAIPQAMRVGVMQSLRDYVNTTAARKQWALHPDETDHYLAAAAHLLSRSPERLAARQEEIDHALATGDTQRAEELRAAADAEEAEAANAHDLLDAGNPGKEMVKSSARAIMQPMRARNAGMWHGINTLLNDPIRRDLALRLVHDGNGHIATGVAMTGEGSGGASYDHEPNEKADIGLYTAKSELKNQPQLKWAGSKDFDTFSPDSDLYDGYWHSILSKLSNDIPTRIIAKELFLQHRNPEISKSLDDIVQEEADRVKAALNDAPGAHPSYLKEKPIMRAYDNIRAKNMTAEDFAYKRVDAIRGMLHGADGTFHADIAAKLAKGEAPDLQTLQAIEKPSRPAQVYGPVRVPYIGPNVLQKVINKGFARMVDPVINHLSRDPMFFNSVYDEYRRLMPLVKANKLDEDTALRIAKTRGAVSMLPKIHNTALRSQFAVLARNYLPFYFAQEQALKRTGILVADHPGALRQYQLVEQGLNDPGFVQKDASGNRYLLFPLSGAIGGAMGYLQHTPLGMSYGLPLSVKGSLSSLDTILPEAQMPGVSPMVSLPLNKLADMFPELSPAVKDIVGSRGYGQAAMSALLPNPLLKGVYQYLNADDMDKSFGNAYMTAIAAAVNNGKAPGPDASPEEQQAFLDKIKQNVRSTFMLKGLLGLISPLAPQVHITDLTKNGTEFRDEFNALVDKSNYKDALAKFLDEHGSKAVSYTISHTKPTIDGSYFPYTQGMLDYLQSPISREIMNSPFATGGAFLVPQTEGPGDIQVIHSELMKMHLREQQTPADFLKAVYIAQGNADIRDDRNRHEANLAKFAGNSQATAAENQAWSDWVKGKAHANPIWYADYTSQDRTNIAVRAFQDLYDMYQYGGQTVITGGKKVVVPQLPDTQQTRLVMGLMADYAQHTRNLAKVKGTHSATVERQRWSDYLKQVEQQQPLLQTVITSVFSRLDGSNV